MKVCVFCSSSDGIDQKYIEHGVQLAEGLVRNEWTLVYGGAQVGLMGHLANTVMNQGGQAIGYMPAFLAVDEMAHPNLTYLEIVPDLMERKRKMIQASDAFVVLPGGIGTLDEAIEVITWKILKQLDQPIVFFNPDGFWDLQVRFFEQLHERKMLSQDVLESYKVFDKMEPLIQFLKNHER